MSANQDAARLVDAKLASIGDWRGAKLARLRAVIKTTDPAIAEDMKWKKPSNPTGVPVWSHHGIVCIGEALKSRVRLTFPKGALLPDPKHLFNARTDSNSVRAIDFEEADDVDEAALSALILKAVELNESKPAAAVMKPATGAHKIAARRAEPWGTIAKLR